jgi:transposase-like protein
MAAQKKYPDELRERAVKMVLEIRSERARAGELFPAVTFHSISGKRWLQWSDEQVRHPAAREPCSRHFQCS